MSLVTLGALIVAAPAMGYVTGKRIWVRASGTATHGRSFAAISKGPSGTFYAAGFVHTSAARGDDVLLVKYDAAGTAKWTRTWAGPGAADDQAVDLAADAKGNVYVLASSAPGAKFNMAVLKYTASGLFKWSQTRPGTEASGIQPVALAVDGSGNVIACGSDWGTPARTEIVIRKYAAAGGTKLWESGMAPWSGDPNEGSLWATDMALDAAGNAYVAGGSLYAGSSRAMVWRFNAGSGAPMRGTPYDAAAGSEATAIAVRGGSAVITGWAAASAGAERCLVVKYGTSLLDELARTEYHNIAVAGARDFGNDVAIGARGEVYVTGYSKRDPPGGSGYSNGCQIVKFGPDLTTVPWHRIYQPGGGAKCGSEGFHLVLDGAGNAYVAGEIETNASGEDLLVLKYGTLLGARKWVQRWNAGGSKDDDATDLTLGGSTAVYVVGFGTARGGVEKAVAMRINR